MAVLLKEIITVYFDKHIISHLVTICNKNLHKKRACTMTDSFNTWVISPSYWRTPTILEVLRILPPSVIVANNLPPTKKPG